MDTNRDAAGSATALEMPPAESWGFEAGSEITLGTRAIALLGDGNRTETWLAWDVRRWAPVTVKICRPDHVRSERAIAGLRREADAHRTLRHPSIRDLLDDGVDTPHPHLVMEYVQGPTLADCLGEGPFVAVDVIRIGLQLGSVLHYLHRRGWLYLDLKPHNVILYAGQAVLIDLGFVRPVGWCSDDGVPRGSRPYMAPEQCRCEPVTAATDLFGLGTVLYEIATGTPPFASDESCFEQLEQSAAPVRSRAPDLPAAVAGVVDSLLEPAVACRPASAAAVLEALDGALPADQDPMWPSFVTPLLRRGPGTS
jgi:eukaryotic-like serine/threonine-protein kinase